MSATFSSMWTSIAPALADHLWQSSLFVLAAALLTFTLRNNHARARYWLWLAASVKFLVPFSWLISLGGKLSWMHATPVIANADSYLTSTYVTVEQISQPFTQRSADGISMANIFSTFSHWLPAFLAVTWLAGFLAVLLTWFARWWRVSAQVTNAVPLHEGREIEALQRVKRSAGVRQQIQVLLSKTMLEPGIFGLLSPVLVWPRGITDRLENAHLEAILAHELWHVRRRDNLAASVHMMVEAIFWFHPLVWWLGARMVDERERACDEEVLELGSERQVYAESILKVCEFCVGSPLACVAGVTGADLKKRMVHIMSEHVVRKLDFSKKLLLTAVAVAALAAPVGFGLLHATPGHAQTVVDDSTANSASYGSVSIKPSTERLQDNGRVFVRDVRMMHTPGGFSAQNVTLRALIQEAYGVQANQVKGGPDWLDSAKYDIEARAAKNGGDNHFKKRADDNHLMLQQLLNTRAALTMHRETANLPVYTLAIGDEGSKLQPSKATGTAASLYGPPDTIRSDDREMKLVAESAASSTDVDGQKDKIVSDDPQMKLDTEATVTRDRRILMKIDEDRGGMGISAVGMSADDLAQELSRLLGVPVMNQTALKGRFDFNLHWTRAAGESPEPSGHPPSDPAALLAAVQEQLGLKLTPQNAPTQVLVIDHIEKPAEN